MALSFLSLPPELRVQIYRYLLCRNSWIQPQRSSDMKGWPCEVQAISARAPGLLTSIGPGPSTEYSPESAILRTCRIIYTEAMPVLYGENSFLYICCKSVLNQADYPKAGFPDKNLNFMKHLELEVQEEQWVVEISGESIAAAILHFLKGGCDLRTFKLTLFEAWDLSDGEEYTGYLVSKICTSSELVASLVALPVSESLTVSIGFGPYDRRYDDEIRRGARDEYQGFVNRLALEKGMNATMEVDDPEIEADDSKEPYDYETCEMSWCFRPQRSLPQSSETPSLTD